MHGTFIEISHMDNLLQGKQSINKYRTTVPTFETPDELKKNHAANAAVWFEICVRKTLL
jgi:hypothetical protein